MEGGGRVRDSLAAARLFQELFSSIKTLKAPYASINTLETRLPKATGTLT